MLADLLAENVHSVSSRTAISSATLIFHVILKTPVLIGRTVSGCARVLR
jgi:hypothetical protein